MAFGATILAEDVNISELMKKIKYLNLYKKERAAYLALLKLPKRVLQKMGYLAGLEMSHYNKNKKLLAKGIYIALGGYIPVNFGEW